MHSQHQKYSADVQRTLDLLPWARIDEMVDVLQSARINRQQIFIIGNGGSAATASHFACDLGKNIVVPHLPRLRVQSLTDNMSFFSACANDYGYESVFAEQLANLIERGDIVIAISASGNSPNVLRAIELAQEQEAFTIGWSGYQGGKLADLANLAIVVANDCIEQIEDIHLILAHMVTVALRQAAHAHRVQPNPPLHHALFANPGVSVKAS
ncbi:MAG: SIS domain-containing protein [Caldilineaceae bacterium]|nr:SIS domain-containing protein [Caldilineaceae bacterium]